MTYNHQVGNPVPLKTPATFVTVTRGIKRIKATASDDLPIARKSKPRLIDYDVLPGQPDKGKQGDVSVSEPEPGRQDMGGEADVSTVQAGSSTLCDQRRGKIRNDMKGLHDLLNTSMDSYKKNIKDTELGTLRILEKDVMDKALSKAIFRRGKTMASQGNFYYRSMAFSDIGYF